MSGIDVILHPTDFSEEADRAFQLGCSIARDHGATLVIIHVIPPTVDSSDDIESDLLNEAWPIVQRSHEQFERMKAMAPDLKLKFHLVKGYPVGMILNVAHEEQADLIVIASERRTPSPFQMHGSVAAGVLRQAACPVCCVRQPDPAKLNSTDHSGKSASYNNKDR